MNLAGSRDHADCNGATTPLQAAVSQLQSALSDESIVAEDPSRGALRPRAPRRNVGVPQWIAPFNGRDFPDLGAFREALCLNISRTGIAMVLPVRPDWQYAVVGLRLERRVKYMRAALVRREPIECSGRTHYVVGLRFQGVIEPPKWMVDGEGADGSADADHSLGRA